MGLTMHGQYAILTPMDKFSNHDQDELRIRMLDDLEKLGPVKRAIINLTMQNESFVLQQDEARLMRYIADNGYLPWQDSSKPLMIHATRAMDMIAIGNARAVVDKCQRLGYIKGIVRDGHGRLVLTQVGWDMLDLHETEEELECEDENV